jgi:hypothetical protein
MDWPDDADGDVMRRLRAGGFDFGKPELIDFNVDFESWPPDQRALNAISQAFPDATISLEATNGYVLVQLRRTVSYELVTSVQDQLSSLTASYGGQCDSWGVMHNA